MTHVPTPVKVTIPVLITHVPTVDDLSILNVAARPEVATA